MLKRSAPGSTPTDEYSKIHELTKKDKINARLESREKSLEAKRQSTERTLAEISATHFAPIADSSLQLLANTSWARVVPLPRGNYPTKLEVFLGLVGKWIQNEVRPAAALNGVNRIASIAHEQRRHWKEPQTQELVSYFLYLFLEGLIESPEKGIDSGVVKRAQKGLIGKTRRTVFNTMLNLGNDTVNSIVDAVPRYLRQYIQLGGAVVIDEAIWSLYSQNAKDHRQTRHIPEKPHPDGLLTYILCQRLHYSQRPIPISFCPTYTNPRPSPRDALVRMLHPFLRGEWTLPRDWILVADSLWNYPRYVLEFQELEWKFAISSKANSSIIPLSLRQVASADLPLGRARTYSDGFLTLQVYHSDRGISAIISNAFGQKDAPPPPPLPSLSYKSAVILFNDNSPAALITAFKLPLSMLTFSKEEIVHYATGWDVLRLEDQQGDASPLSADVLKQFDRNRVATIFEKKFRTLNYTKMSKDVMIELLCPEDSEQPKRKSQKRKVEIAVLEAQLEEVQGPSSSTHCIYDTFHSCNSCIDQLDREYYQHGHVRYQHGSMHVALSCVAYYLLVSSLAIYDEYQRARIHATTQGNNAAVMELKCPSMQDFLLDVTNEWKEWKDAKGKDVQF